MEGLGGPCRPIRTPHGISHVHFVLMEGDIGMVVPVGLLKVSIGGLLENTVGWKHVIYL